MTDYKALCAELLKFAENLTKHYYQPAELVIRARTALTQPQPAGEVADTDWWCEVIDKAWDKYETVGHQGERFMYDSDFGLAVDFIRAELSRCAPVQPVNPPS